MQVKGMTVWGQRNFASEDEHKQPAETARQDNEEKTLQGSESAWAKKQEKDSYEQSDEETFQYLEILKQERSSADKQRQAQSDELKALRIAHNIMRGKKVPPKDESFLLTKNFKMYMAAKNVASMKECTGSAKSELGDDGGTAVSCGAGVVSGGSASGSAGAMRGSSASGSAWNGSAGATDGLEAAMAAAGSLAAGGSGELADGLAADVAELAAVEGFKGAGEDAMADGLLSGSGLFTGNGRTVAEGFSFSAQGKDYGTLIEGMKASSATRGSGISHTASTKKKRKRFQYNFKEISARIMSAKTSGNAKQVLAQAAQNCAFLRKKLKSGEYDEEAVQMALIHAEAMERVAKKKMKHLEEEEAAKKAGGVCAGDTDDEVRRKQQMQDEQMRYEMQAEAAPGNSKVVAAEPAMELPAEDVSMEELMAEAVQTPVLDVTGGMEELMEDFEELMEDTLEEAANLGELAEEMLSGGGKTIDPADLEEKKRKHRTEEQRAIAEADSKYLKAFFNKLQREQRAIASGASKIAAAMNNGGGILSLASNSTPAATPSTTSSAGTPGGQTGTGTATAAPMDAIQTATASVAESSGVAAPTVDLAVGADTAVSATVSIDVSV